MYVGQSAGVLGSTLHGLCSEGPGMPACRSVMPCIADSEAAGWCIRKLEVLQGSSDRMATFQQREWMVG